MIWSILCIYLTLFSRIDASVFVPIIIENDTTGTKLRIGELAYENNAAEFFLDEDYVFVEDISAGDHICVGYESDDGLFNCFSYKEFVPDKCMKFSIYQNEGTVISYNFEFKECNGDPLVVVEILKPLRGKVPELVKIDDEKSKTRTKPGSTRNGNNKTKSQNQSDADGSEETFFQKYWMFLIPLGIMMIFSGSSNKSE